MGHIDPWDSYDGRAVFLQELLYDAYLGNVHAGIARQLIAKGENSLSSRQQMVLEVYILGEFKDKVCSLCQCGPEWEDMYEVAFGEGYCSFCLNLVSKGD